MLSGGLSVENSHVSLDTLHDLTDRHLARVHSKQTVIIPPKEVLEVAPEELGSNSTYKSRLFHASVPHWKRPICGCRET